MAPLPTFIIAGAMRCGTTSLNGYLREHPEIAVSQPKEVHFFDNRFAEGMGWYQQHFAHIDGARIIGEATPDYLYHPDAMARIAAAIPDVKILLLLRNPVDRAYSHYWHNVSRDKESLPFGDAVAAEPERIAADPAQRARYSYVDRGRYERQITSMLEHFDRRSVLAQTFEQLEADPVGTYRRTLEFLGADTGFRPENLGVALNAYVEFRSPWIREATKRLPRPLKNAIAKLNQKAGSPYPAMDTAVKRHLVEDLASANDGLEAAIGVDPSPWWA